MEAVPGKLKVEGSRVILTPPRHGGSDPVIVPVKGLKLYVNGEHIQTPAPVGPDDTVTLESCTEVLEKGIMNIKLSDDHLSASLMLKKRVMVRFLAADTPESSELKPRVTEERFEEDDINLEQVYAFLDKRSIHIGLLRQAIEEAVALMNGEWVEIARGTPPTAGENARLEVFFDHIPSSQDHQDVLENVNYRDRGVVPCVDPDTLLARKTPAIPGKGGKTVTGNVIHPRPIVDFYLKAGKNTAAGEDGLEIYSKALGLPRLEKQAGIYSVFIEPCYVVKGDVDLNTGHIRFRGDIQVNGNVTESMEVHSERDVEVKETVNNALLMAEGSITVRGNVINSRILAGARQSYGFQVKPPLVAFESTLVEILKAYQQISGNPRHKNTRFGYILDLLVSQKYSNFLQQLDALHTKLAKDPRVVLGEELTKNIASLKQYLHEFRRLPYQEVTDAVQLLQSTGALKRHLKFEAAHTSQIHVLYCLNSYLEASGSVFVTGQGCFHTDITAHGSIEARGTLRGGTLKAGGDIRLNEVGSEAAINTKIQGPPDGKVFINKAYENTVVTLGESFHRFTMPRSRVKVFLNQDTNSLEISTY